MYIVITLLYDRNAYGGGVAIYVQNQIPVKIRNDFGCVGVEALWLQVQLPHLRPVLIGVRYRPPNVPTVYLDKICTMLDKVCDTKYEIYFLGDLNIDWHLNNCLLKNKLFSLTEICNLSQVVKKSTRVSYRSDGTKIATCIDLIFTNAADLCSKAISMPVGFSDHNLVSVNRKTKVPKSGQKMIVKRIFKHFNENEYCEEVRNVDWSKILVEDDPDRALEAFTSSIMPIMDKHAPLRRITVRTIAAPWVDLELKEHIKLRNELKAEAITSGNSILWNKYRKLRNYVTKLNRTKKRNYYEN